MLTHQMMKLFRSPNLYSLLATMVAMTALPVSAQFGDFGIAGEGGAEADPAKAKLVSEVSSIAPGKPFTVALQLDHTEGWHSYYLNPATVGLAPSIQWKLPDGFTAGPIQWPVPEKVQSFGNTVYAYEGKTAFLVTITPPANLTAGATVELNANAAWQVCDESSCKDGREALKLSLPVAAEAVKDSRNSEFFTQAMQAQPVVAGDAWKVDAGESGQSLTIRLTPGKGAAIPKDLYFFSADKQGDAQKPQTVTQDGTTWIITVPRATQTAIGDDITPLPHLSGIVYSSSGWVEGKAGQHGLLLDQIPFGAAPASASAKIGHEPVEMGKLLFTLGGMFLGGLILNLMPCVFPVIGLKILGFAQQAGSDKRKVAIHGVIFTLGVLLSFWVLSGILFAAREALAGKGGNINWGYQLENPYVVFSLMLLMFVLALNMFGLFEIGASATSVGGNLQSKQGFAGSFFSGVLATVVSTPCSAPFLGAAIGAAVAFPTVEFFLAFTAMALGLSLPYLLLSIFPQLIDRLPRPGPWMESFKQGMSFLLFATAGYLLWVYIGQVGLTSMLDVVFGLSAIAMGAWIWGRWNTPIRKRSIRLTATVIAILIAAWGIFASLPPKKSELKWEHWSQQRVDELLKEGKPVYIDFTAQWCLTCQVNKKRAYTKEIVDLMNKRGIVALKADKTNPSPEIDKAISQYGRSAIPVNVLHVPGEKEPFIFPEVLSPDLLRTEFENRTPEKK